MERDLATALRIKYGLSDDPSSEAIKAWAKAVEALLGEGVPSEDAGRRAAVGVFGELEGILYFSEADTLEALLRRAQAK
jgi:hypothetical protein